MRVFQSDPLERTIIAGSILVVLLLIKKFHLSYIQAFLIGLGCGSLGHRLYSLWRKKTTQAAKTD